MFANTNPFERKSNIIKAHLEFNNITLFESIS